MGEAVLHLLGPSRRPSSALTLSHETRALDLRRRAHIAVREAASATLGVDMWLMSTLPIHAGIAQLLERQRT